MKKKTYKFVSITIIAIVMVFGSQLINAKIPPITDPDCPNGCVEGNTGCHCHIDYPNLKEYIWVD
jgi:hypothetical protein